MSGEQESKIGYGRLLDAWCPPEGAGEPIGCVATSFTFQPDVFEEECLSRFVQMESSIEDGATFLIEREEKLAKLACAAALVDQRYARGSRNVRWDLLPARPPRGSILHAKVAVLLWASHARLIVASANLTKNGCRRNHEIFGVLDYHEQSNFPLSVLDEFIAFLAKAVDLAPHTAGIRSPAIDRWHSFLKSTTRASRGWGTTQEPRGWAQPRILPVITGNGRPGVFDTLRERWPDTGRPNYARVLSPFFDQPGKRNDPARELWKLLRQRGDASVDFHVEAEEAPNGKEIILRAPRSLMDAEPSGRVGASTRFFRSLLETGRPLHAKCLWLEDDKFSLYMVGSSNFTSAGLGLGRVSNVEANLCYVVNHDQSPAATRALRAVWLPAEEIPISLKKLWMPLPEEGEDAADPNDILLPDAFAEAIFYSEGSQGGFVEFSFLGDPPVKFALYREDEMPSDPPFLQESDWKTRGGPALLRVPWIKEHAPSGFKVEWEHSKGSAWWPVNVSSPDALPPPAELRDLPLETLVEVLTSAKPLHIVLGRILRKKGSPKRNDRSALDPHKLVDTSSFLLQRTRRVSRAFEGMRERLERPVTTGQALAWRLRGPVGPLALAKAISEGAVSSRERCFLLLELCLEMSRVRPCFERGGLSRAQVRRALQGIVNEIRAGMPATLLEEDAGLARYYRAAQVEISR